MKVLRPYQLDAVAECYQALKASSDPVLLMASVGAGKSLMIADILLRLQAAGKRALCLVNNSELVRNNCETFRDQGGDASIYCASLNSKSSTSPIVFGSPQSILNGIKRDKDIAKIKFNLIVVDEAHAINHTNHRSIFMRILRHYRQIYPDMRLLGATGTDFRFKGTDIVGPKCLFKSRVGNITTEWLIEQGYLVKPEFRVDPKLTIDFTSLKVKSNGQFDHQQLESVIKKNTRLTALIMKQLIHIMETQNRHGCVIFASTKKHAFECASSLPPTETAVVLGEMPNDERTQIFNKARKGEIKYLVNISIVSVGVDLPAYDTLAYLRPTESLVLVVQTMGRVLRLSPGKQTALILDFAGNILRHEDWDNPILLEALEETRDKDAPLIFPCYVCNTLNSEHARRCVGMVNNKRCEHYFEFKECKKCGGKNDITSRYCRECEHELIDPNAKLSLDTLQPDLKQIKVLKAHYWIQEREKGYIFNASYHASDNKVYYESFSPCASEKAKHMFYGTFVKKHLNNSSAFYPYLNNIIYMRAMLNLIESPRELIIKDGVIKKKVFEGPNNL